MIVRRITKRGQEIVALAKMPIIFDFKTNKFDSFSLIYHYLKELYSLFIRKFLAWFQI